jgi:signal transduction histidine kinase
MTSKQLRSALHAGRRVYGTLVVSDSPRWPAQIAQLGLDFVFIDTEHVALDRQPLELDAVIDEALAQQAPLAEPRGLRLERHLPPSLPPVLADAGLVSRVLQNLIGNAVKFAARGGRVEVTAAVLAGQPPMLRVMVSNEGDGIDPEVRGRLFQKFAASRHRDHGSGLGLAFCRLAVEAHGGKVWAESEPGKGAAVSFTLRSVASLSRMSLRTACACLTQAWSLASTISA